MGCDDIIFPCFLPLNKGTKGRDKAFLTIYNLCIRYSLNHWMGLYYLLFYSVSLSQVK